MNIQTLSPQGYNINDNPVNINPFWIKGKFQCQAYLYVDDDPIEPGYDFIFKSVMSNESVRVTSHYGYVEAELSVGTVYDLQPINGNRYLFNQHELIYTENPGMQTTTYYLRTAGEQPTTYTFSSDYIVNGGAYSNLLMTNSPTFTISGLTSSDTVSVEYNEAVMILLNGSLDSETGIYSGSIFGMNFTNDDYPIKIKVNDTVVCSFTFNCPPSINVDQNVTVYVGETTTLSYTTTHLEGYELSVSVTEGQEYVSASIDTINSTVSITGISEGSAVVSILANEQEQGFSVNINVTVSLPL